jgi:hypothetical protein
MSTETFFATSDRADLTADPLERMRQFTGTLRSSLETLGVSLLKLDCRFKLDINQRVIRNVRA